MPRDQCCRNADGRGCVDWLTLQRPEYRGSGKIAVTKQRATNTPAQIFIQRYQMGIKCPVQCRRKTEAIGRVQPIGAILRPRDDVAGNQKAWLRHTAGTATIIEVGQYRAAEKLLTDPPLVDLLGFRCAVFWNSLCRCATDRCVPIARKRRPRCPVCSRRAAETLAAGLDDLGVKAGEVGKLHGHGRRRTAKPPRQRNDLRIAAVQPPKWCFEI